MRQAAATAASLEPGPPEGNAAVLRLRGRLDVYSVAAIWDAALAALEMADLFDRLDVGGDDDAD